MRTVRLLSYALATSVTIYRVEGKCELSVKEELPVHGRIVCMKAIQLTVGLFFIFVLVFCVLCSVEQHCLCSQNCVGSPCS